ncbi:ZRT1 [Auxenochlorella protothecoides x Auxenochlorella symbiontica]
MSLRGVAGMAGMDAAPLAPSPPHAPFSPWAHVAGAGLLCLASLAGVALPPALRRGRLARSAALATAVRLGTCFGFGTILATAVVHMLPSAVHCLTLGTGQAPPALAYWLILAALLGMHFLDWAVALAAQGLSRRPGTRATAAAARALHHHHGDGGPAAGAGGDDGAGEDALCCCADPACGRPCVGAAAGPEGGAADAAAPLLRRPAAAQRQRPVSGSAAGDLVGLVLLELGVSVHSTLVGVGLGVARAAAFHTLLAALCVHQFFEGIALGGATADVDTGYWLAVALGGVFSLSTPLGVLLGVGLREAAASGGRRGASTLEGSLEALATGILLYVGLVQLLTPHMTRTRWMARAGPATQAGAFLSLWAGAAAMAFLGAWV